jgi:hypothetical protein
MTFRNDLASLVRSVDSALALIGHQLFQFTNPGNHELQSGQQCDGCQGIQYPYHPHKRSLQAWRLDLPANQ